MTSSRRERLALALVILVGVVVAWWLGFVQDDAYISFRYARNLVEGHGLVFNPGERVEGYTNFLWTLMMAVPIKLGFDAGRAAFWTGLVLYPFTLYASYRLFRLCVQNVRWSIIGVAILALNPTFAAYATGGLETQLQTLLLVLCALFTIRVVESGGTRDAVVLSVVASLALLCRLDSAAVVAVCYGLALWSLAGRRSWSPVVASVGLPTIVMVVWSLWRHSYFGAWLPNTFVAKVGGAAHLQNGLAYWKQFSWAYGAPFLVIYALYAALAGMTLAVRLAAVVSILWAAYVIGVGGDFMEFRFGAVVYPYLIGLFVYGVSRFRWRERYRLLLPGLLIAIGVLYGRSVGYGRPIDARDYPGDPISSVYQLKKLVDAPYGWVFVGKRLGQIFGPESDVTIATTAAGAIPYYSGLRAIDMHGLTDAEIARFGRRDPTRMLGHQVAATVEQLKAKKVNLVIAHPQVLGDPLTRGGRPGGWITYHFKRDPGYAGEMETTRGLLIPLDDRTWLVTWYLTSSEEIEQHIRNEHWPVMPMEELWDYSPGKYPRLSGG